MNSLAVKEIESQASGGRTMVFIGQDTEAIDGYMAHVHSDQMPLDGFMVYTALHNLTGLATPISYGAGEEFATGLLKKYPDVKGKRRSLQLAIWMVDFLDKVVAGQMDGQIKHLAEYLEQCGARHIFLRLGYEFDNPWNHYDPKAYREAFRYIVDYFRGFHVELSGKTSFVFHSWAFQPWRGYDYEDWYPGDEYVDLCAISVFQQPLYLPSSTPYSSFWKAKKKATENFNRQAAIAAAAKNRGHEEQPEQIAQDQLVHAAAALAKKKKNYKHTTLNDVEVDDDDDVTYYDSSLDIILPTMPPIPLSTSKPYEYIDKMADFAKKHVKPLMIAESTPFGGIDPVGNDTWHAWFEPVFELIEKHDIRLFSYINCNWDSQPMWDGQGWGDTRIEINAELRRLWRRQLKDPRFQSSDIADQGDSGDSSGNGGGGGGVVLNITTATSSRTDDNTANKNNQLGTITAGAVAFLIAILLIVYNSRRIVSYSEQQARTSNVRGRKSGSGGKRRRNSRSRSGSIDQLNMPINDGSGSGMLPTYQAFDSPPHNGNGKGSDSSAAYSKNDKVAGGDGGGGGGGGGTAPNAYPFKPGSDANKKPAKR